MLMRKTGLQLQPVQNVRAKFGMTSLFFNGKGVGFVWSALKKRSMLERAGAMLENDPVMLAYEMQIEVKRYI